MEEGRLALTQTRVGISALMLCDCALSASKAASVFSSTKLGNYICTAEQSLGLNEGVCV